ncbi:prefoldin subunit alpha [Haloarcula onubensis]|uniref:Prefoldin subunit alpha n=1 Tax=Haloarcula onubensis TaxID=2950539 RepID=A0ABU2FN32_9EURY|nr:prefoldin subunit alpha [Halomicroarcula sp. S3CR25-11]MDS0282159.1 prefoldin subunit alpha [Halomicroarcula sp. S3CR25-11]
MMGGGGGGGGGMQQLQQEIEQLEAEMEAIDEEVERLQEKQSDIDDAIEAIDVLESGSTVQVPVGGDAYVRATVDDIDEIVVSLGGGYAAERDQDGAVDTLEAKKETLDDHIDGLHSDKAEVESEMTELEQQAQQMQQQQMQQMMQQREEQSDE